MVIKNGKLVDKSPIEKLLNLSGELDIVHAISQILPRSTKIGKIKSKDSNKTVFKYHG